jgi:uncharacterized protein (DUF302 family)
MWFSIILETIWLKLSLFSVFVSSQTRKQLTKQVHDVTAFAKEESTKSKAVKEIINTLTSQVEKSLPTHFY